MLRPGWEFYSIAAHYGASIRVGVTLNRLWSMWMAGFSTEVLPHLWVQSGMFECREGAYFKGLLLSFS